MRLKGNRTFISAAIFELAGIASILGGLDLTPLVRLYVHNPDYLAVTMLGIGALIAVLRSLTNTAPGGNLSADQGAPVYKGVDGGV